MYIFFILFLFNLKLFKHFVFTCRMTHNAFNCRRFIVEMVELFRLGEMNVTADLSSLHRSLKVPSIITVLARSADFRKKADLKISRQRLTVSSMLFIFHFPQPLPTSLFKFKCSSMFDHKAKVRYDKYYR